MINSVRYVYFLCKVVMNCLLNFSFIFFVFIFVTKSASAYIDPGTGSFLLQIIVGAVLGGIFTFKIYFKKIKDFCTKLVSKKNSNNE